MIAFFLAALVAAQERDLSVSARVEPRLPFDSRPGIQVRLSVGGPGSLRVTSMTLASVVNDQGVALQATADGSPSDAYPAALSALLSDARTSRTFQIEEAAASRIRLKGTATVALATATRWIIVEAKEGNASDVDDHSIAIGPWQASSSGGEMFHRATFHLRTKKETLGHRIQGMHAIDPTSFVAVDEAGNKHPCEPHWEWGSMRLTLRAGSDPDEKVGTESQPFALVFKAPAQVKVREVRFRWIEKTELRKVPLNLEVTIPR